MCRSRFLLLAGSLLLLFSTALAQNGTPAAAVNYYYAFEKSGRNDVFNRRNIDVRKQWLSTRFYNQFIEELRKEKAYLKTHPTDKPFFGDGFSFSPLDEACVVNGRSLHRKYSVQKAVVSRDTTALVPVKFAYPKPCTVEPIKYRVKLVRSDRGWLIDDLIYDDGSTLSGAMKKNRY